MIRRIDHIGLVSPSWEEARSILGEKLGFPVRRTHLNGYRSSLDVA